MEKAKRGKTKEESHKPAWEFRTDLSPDDCLTRLRNWVSSNATNQLRLTDLSRAGDTVQKWRLDVAVSGHRSTQLYLELYLEPTQEMATWVYGDGDLVASDSLTIALVSLAIPGTLLVVLSNNVSPLSLAICAVMLLPVWFGIFWWFYQDDVKKLTPILDEVKTLLNSTSESLSEGQST